MTGLIALTLKTSKRFDLGNGWMMEKGNPADPDWRGGVLIFHCTKRQEWIFHQMRSD
jgi:hypothetical protein